MQRDAVEVVETSDATRCHFIFARGDDETYGLFLGVGQHFS